MMFFAIRVTTMALLITVATGRMILLAALLPTAVSGFTIGPRQKQHLDHRLMLRNGVCGSSMIRTIPVLQASVLEEPATETPIGEAGTTESETPKDSSDDDNGGNNFLTIVPPNAGFRNTAPSGGTEVSIASMNLLAPFYNSLQLRHKNTTEYERWEFLNTDRTQRVPEAIDMAKRTNADVLCLQEIEGGKLGEAGAAAGKEFTLRDDVRAWLAEPTTTTTTAPDGTTATITVEGYDSCVWSPLNPGNKRGDVVGLCIAWRSGKHALVEWEGYKRGMVCRLREAAGAGEDESSTASFAIANLHLPARPSNVLGRLSTMSRTIRKLSDLDRAIRRDRSRSAARSGQPDTIDGLLVVAGDFNSDQDSVAARLLFHGSTNYGNVRDRNYKAKITKASAAKMSHPYRFIDSYDHGEGYGSGRDDPRFRNGGSFRDLYAPVTVSLRGRGPGIMDHLFYATGTAKGGSTQKHQRLPKVTPARRQAKASAATAGSTREALSDSILREQLGKRSKRRRKGEARGGGGGGGGGRAVHHGGNTRIVVESVLATIDPMREEDTAPDGRRWKTIHEGLPNREEGFPSDHLPVGVLFSAAPTDRNRGDNQANATDRAPAAPAATATAATDSNPSKDIAPKALATENEDSPSTTSSGGTIADPTLPTDAASSHDSTNANEASTDPAAQSTQTGGVSASVKRRRRSSRTSFGLRRRHNAVLKATTEWLVGRGATSVVLDKPLYKNDLLARTLGPGELRAKLKKKSRAPDLICGHVDASSGEESLVVVEVAVASDPDKVRAQKSSKYSDLVTLLERSGTPCRLAAIVVGDDGMVPGGTRSDIHRLAELTSGRIDEDDEKGPDGIEAETDRLCELLGSIASSFRVR